ncbi:flavin reductase family protein [Xanthobacter sp. AM11]|uniref:flavin reductase family protein n=1 Tax=Xanthobacter sp. AM11 TaxID=3380643 RepID=UPI0039BF3C7A
MTTIDLDARIDPRELRNALGRFATGIAVVMAKDEEGPLGVTVNSFSSVSLDPPLVLFCMARSLHSLARLEKAKAYSVNILHGTQVDISNRFARAGEDKFTQTDCVDGCLGEPCLMSSHATFECVPYAHYDGGDHVIFVGRVVHMRAEGEDDPLLYYRGSYRLLASLIQEG